MSHRFNPKHLHKLESPERRKALPPDEILGLFGTPGDANFADVGCGPGYFTIPLAKRTTGKVYALDVSSEMLNVLTERVQEANVTNVENVLSNAEQIALPDHSVDGVLCSLVLHEVDDLKQTLSEFRRVLRPGGKMLLIEWEKKQMEMGPPVEIRISSDELLEYVGAAGLQGQIVRPNPDQYIVLAH
ncbi:class I SAM-dependent methyltransferase [Alicyclobacillus ferrooxydans]|uniref:Methyltransferase type 11 domain-containing protein n=1 Tax=Alicyclobacillus ferrooxydans TaxID=471514 RepID=A0A0P9GWC2_9BACL|nr:methyltransferase domain-containing protein [Alicyclobacillus ferrooxydans]KPV45580.1 hypothetical protein AN477_01230 [Alicyclobacillus ferrooxydans]